MVYVNKRPIVNITFDGYKDIKIELYPERVKESVNNLIFWLIMVIFIIWLFVE